MSESLLQTLRRVRGQSLALCAPLEPEDYLIQSMPDASPARWHLAHTTWFFETFVLIPFAAKHGIAFEPRDQHHQYLFNSYYNGVGAQFPRHLRGTISRPTLAQIRDWRARVDEATLALLRAEDPQIEALVTLGLHHEQQHQELLLTDLKHALLSQPGRPTYQPRALPVADAPPADRARYCFEETFLTIGHRGEGFCFDNERPAHRAWAPGSWLATDLVTRGQWLDFMADGGYQRHDLWLSDGWDAARRERWEAPLYWFREGDQWMEATLHGVAPVDRAAPVAHVSFFEADAYARWAGARLPLEAEWERAAQANPTILAEGFVEAGIHHPTAPTQAAQVGPRQLFGQVWEWTASPYRPYPGYRPPAGAVGEYNGKFMNGLYVLRGGSCATPRDHIRASYRNFFSPEKRWQFTGLRLAWDQAPEDNP
jgi:ergothioneine biosynthesis protein EgtB